tara:strand:- start:1169 stop:1507 length:339 start_codon:yes stop_codon:yes gene_type:complete
MEDTIKNLTDKERELFNAVIEGMDATGCGWYHELVARTETLEDDHSTAGVLGSLVKKGLVESELHFTGPDCYWVKLTLEGAKAVGLLYDEYYRGFYPIKRGGWLANDLEILV